MTTLQKGISVWAFDPKRPLPEVFAMARKAGFDGVELAIASDGPITPRTTQSECERIREQAAEAGVAIVALASGLGWSLPLTSSDVELRKRGVDAVAASLSVAQHLGTDAILCVPGGVGVDFMKSFAVTSYADAYDNAFAALETLAPVAAETGVTIGLENVWNKFLLSPLETRDFIDALRPKSTDETGTPRIGSYFDVGNVVATGYPEHWVEILGQRVTRVHLKDFQRSVGTIAGFCDLGEGDVDWSAVLTALHRIGYRGFLTAEYFRCEDKLEQIAAAIERIIARGGPAMEGQET